MRIVDDIRDARLCGMRDGLKPPRYRRVRERLRRLRDRNAEALPAQRQRTQRIGHVEYARQRQKARRGATGRGHGKCHPRHAVPLYRTDVGCQPVRGYAAGNGGLVRHRKAPHGRGNAVHHERRLRVIRVAQRKIQGIVCEQAFLAGAVVGIVRMLHPADMVGRQIGEQAGVKGDAPHASHPQPL